MPGRRSELTFVPRFTPHGSWKRAEHDVDGRRLFVVVERSISGRLLPGCGKTRFIYKMPLERSIWRGCQNRCGFFSILLDRT